VLSDNGAWHAATRSAAKVPVIGGDHLRSVFFSSPMSRSNDPDDRPGGATSGCVRYGDEAGCCDRGSIRRAGAVRLKPAQAGGLPPAKWPTSISRTGQAPRQHCATLVAMRLRGLIVLTGRMKQTFPRPDSVKPFQNRFADELRTDDRCLERVTGAPGGSFLLRAVSLSLFSMRRNFRSIISTALLRRQILIRRALVMTAVLSVSSAEIRFRVIP
jgi:hypothetical protein